MIPTSGADRVVPSSVRLLLAALIGLAAMVLGSTAAEGHGFSSVVYAGATQQDGAIHVDLELEYDLLVVSVAENERAPEFFEDGMAVWRTGDEPIALGAHAEPVLAYVTERFRIDADGAPCAVDLDGELGVTVRHDVPYAVVPLTFACAPASSHQFTSELFPDAEGYVTGTTTVLEYELAGHRDGNTTIDAAHPTFDTAEPAGERMWRFLLLGAEHLLFGIDHILFLLALIVGSWRLRDIVLAATSFTVAHSVTFILAALGIVSLPDALVEPVIALSIAVVAVWYLWRVWADRKDADPAPDHTRRTGHSIADTARLLVVFAFGLIHGLGFAGALGLDEPFSWGLLGSLLIFNVGLEIAQVAIIVVLFPLLTVLRRRAPRTGLWVGVLVAAGVAVMGVIWFVERILGAG